MERDIEAALYAALRVHPGHGFHAVLMYNALSNYAKLCKVLSGIPVAYVSTVVNTPVHGMQSLLWFACNNSYHDAVLLLLFAGADVNHIPYASVYRDSPLLIYIAQRPVPVVVEELIARGANVNHANALGETPMMWALAKQRPDLVKLLAQ